MLLPTKIIKGMAHITGGGIPGNLVRILPDGCRAVVDVTNIPKPPIFELIQKTGDIPADEMSRVFNMGCGYTIVVRRGQEDKASGILHDADYEAIICGEIVAGEKKVIIEGNV